MKRHSEIIALKQIQLIAGGTPSSDHAALRHALSMRLYN
jgi:hypothetical protein